MDQCRSLAVVTGRTLTVHTHAVQEAVWNIAWPDAPPTEGEVHVWFAPLDRLLPELDSYRDLLDPVESERADRFRFKHDRERFIVGHGWLRELLGRYLKRDGSLIRFARGPFGKPHLERKKLQFNFSDTKDAILIGFATGMEIGVDLETLAREVDHAAVSEHYFTPTEITAIQASGPDAKRRFLEFWTRKEAVLKASGVGIMEDLRVLRVDGEHNVMTIEHDAFVKMAATEYHLDTRRASEHHVISIALPRAADGIRFIAI